MSNDLRTALWGLLPAKLSVPEKTAFLDAVSTALSAPKSDTTPISQTLEAAQQIESEAKRLQAALRAFRPHVFRASPLYGELVYMRKFANRLPPQLQHVEQLEDLLELSFHVTLALRSFAMHYAERVNPSRQTKPEVQAARSLITDIVWKHRDVLGALPKGAWFFAFIKRIGDDSHVALPCGRDLVTQSVKAVKDALAKYHEANIRAARAMHEMAEAEGRPFTPDEDQQFKRLMSAATPD
jgi:hypothetical protein